MQAATLISALRSDGALLAAAATRVDRDAPVPGLAWSVREVVVHTGAVHRWAADIVRRGLSTNETGGSAAFHPELAHDSELTEWYAEGLAALVATLSEAPADLAAWTFARGLTPREFWCRRQAHETAVHRADVEAVAGEVTAFDPGFAQDGLDELVGGFARQRAFATAQPGRLRLAATDGDDWLVTFGGERNRSVANGVGEADATVTGSSSELYLWAWNRPSPAVVTGDERVVDLWRRVRIR